MTPETARQTIEKYLDLGTLQGVEVQYENKEIIVFYTTIEGDPFYEEDGEFIWTAHVLDDGIYENIKSIHPIPLQPKLLEVGTKVRVIGGKMKGEVAEIYQSAKGGEYAVRQGNRGFNVSIFGVVPESLLVEEEESEKVITIPESKVLFEGNYLLSDVEKALKQAGYKVTKE